MDTCRFAADPYSGFHPPNRYQGQVLFSDPVVWVARTGFKFEKGKRLLLAVFQENSIFRKWALAAMDKAGIDYRIGYVSHCVAGVLDAVRAGKAIAASAKSAVPKDLAIFGIESGLPVLPVANVTLLTSKSSSSHALTRFSGLLIKSFGERYKRRLRLE